LLDVPGAGELAGTTSGKILAAAILALGFGAAMAARDPWRNRLMIQVLIAFTALATLAILIRVLFHDEPYSVDPAWMVLPFAAALPVLFVIFYPRAPSG
jgi:predicted Abi (CAAX) family protease